MIKPEDVIAAVKTYIEDINVESGPVGGSSVGGSKGVYVLYTYRCIPVLKLYTFC